MAEYLTGPLRITDFVSRNGVNLAAEAYLRDRRNWGEIPLFPDSLGDDDDSRED